MGGKHKQAQRTKNNARPSSSGRSAELLGSSIPQFVGFSTVKETGIVVPTFSALSTDEMDSSIDSNFQLVLKKMNKKDSTTKLKALQEFTDLVKPAEVDAIKAILPFWPRLYCALATDTEHRVREAAHIAHHQVVLKAKRNLAPYLKQLAGPWFTSQYDTYAPAATASKKAFQDAFPQNKLQEAIVFCQEEILFYISDNLTVHTVQTLSNPKTTTPEESEAKYQRVLISSLLGYALYLKMVSSEEIEKSIELNLNIISNAKFWKLAKHKTAPVKSAWFQVITNLCQKSQMLREREAAHIVGSVFGNLDESEPIVLPSVWEAVLSVISTIDEWWKYINLEKLVLPKLWKVLKEGGQGSAAVIFPNMLPMISHLPNSVDINNTYCLFFENMRCGLKCKTVFGSRSESQAVSTAFIECLQYIILRNQQDTALCEKLIKTQLFPVLEWSLTNSQASYKTIFNQVSQLIQYWTRNRNNPDFPHYPKYIEYFWNNLGNLFEGLLLNLEHSYEQDSASQLASRQIEFLLSLKHNSKPKKLMKVTFSNEALQSSSDVVDSSSNDTFNEYHLNALNSLVYITCKNYVTFINEKHKKGLIEHLVSLIQDFDRQEFFQYLNTQFTKGDSTSLIEIYRKLLLKWLNSTTLSCKPVVDLIFLLFKYLASNEKEEILNSFTKITKEECFSWCLSQTLSHPHNEDQVVHTWLHNSHVRNFLTNLVEMELKDESSPEYNLILKQAFAERLDGELFISKATVVDIVHILRKPLFKPSNYEITVDSCASFAAYISAMLYTSNFKLVYGDELLLSLFTLSCSTSIDHDILSNDTLWEVNTAWQDAISILSRELEFNDFKNLTSKCADIVEKEVLKNNPELDVNHIVCVIVNFINCLQSNNPLRIYDVLVVFLNRNFVPNSRKELEYVCRNAELIRGRLCSPNKLDRIDVSVNEDDIRKYFIWMELIAHVLTKPMTSINSDEDDEEDSDIEESEKLTVLKMIEVADDVKTLIVDVVYSIALADSFQSNYHCTKYCKSIISSMRLLKTKVKMITEMLDEGFTQQLKCVLIEKIHANGWFWVKASFIFFSDILPENLSTIYTEILRHSHSSDSKLSALHLIQVFADSISFDQMWEKCTTIESIILLRSLIKCEELDVQIAEAFGKIDQIQKDNKAQLMYESAVVETITWEKVELIIEIIRLFSAILKNKPECIQSNRWDFIIISFATWSKNISKYKHKYTNLQIGSFIVALTDLFVSINQYLQQSNKENIKSEWRDIFAQDIHKDLVEIWLYISEKYEDHSYNVPLIDLPFLQEFGKLASHLDYVYMFDKKHQSLPKWSKIVKRSCSLLTHPVNCLQLWGYNMLMVMLPGLVEVDSVSVNTNTPHEKGLIFEQFKDILCHTQDIVQSMLLEFKLGEDSCRVESFTDSYTYTFAYLLLWDILLSLCEKSSTELHYQYADWLKNADLLNNLLDNIYKLIPAEVTHHLDSKVKRYTELFTTKFPISFTDMCTSECIEHIVCWIYSSALSQLPALVRQWWSNKETRVAQIVERVTATFVSPQLCNQELTDVAQHEMKFKNMVVKVHPGVREVVAIYTVDEAQMELVITLPNNYPLVGPDVQCNRQICGTSHRQWLMQLKMCVLHQNGRIWDGLSLWNNNLDKKFDGVEECYICFAVLHQGTYQLPKLSCQTCRKKFHSACLYKWFSTSNKSTCPICRNLF